MILFWLILLLFTLLASGFVLWPLWHLHALDEDKQRLVNKAWYEEQLQTLQHALAQKEIDLVRFEQDKIILQRDFLLFEQRTLLPEKNITHRVFAILLVCLLSLAAFLFYQKLGASQLLAKQYSAQKTKEQIDANIQKMGGAQNVVYTLKQQLSLHPEDAQGWYLLGRIYFSENQFTQARIAFEHAAQLAPQRKEIFIELVEASYLSGDSKTESRLHQALQQMPNEPTLLNISALILYQQKKYQQALTIWQNLLLQLPAHSDEEKALQAMISETEKKLAK